jgi:hypothetical protein
LLSLASTDLNSIKKHSIFQNEKIIYRKSQIRQMNIALRFAYDDERDKIWYEIIRLEYEITQGNYHLKMRLDTLKRRYARVCEILRLH